MRLLVAVALAGLVLAVFGQVRGHEFVDYDDAVYRAVAAKGLSRAGLAHAFTGEVAANWIPASALSIQLGHVLHGDEAGAHLLVNVALHLGAALALFAALLRMTGALAASAFVAAVFAVHPVHVESVAWFSQRKDVLCGLFWMLALWAHAAPEPRRAAVWMFGVLAMLAKPTAVTLPFTLVLVDYWPLARLRVGSGALPDAARLRAALWRQAPLFAAAAAVSVVTYTIQEAKTAVAAVDALPAGVRVANAALSLVAYLTDLLWPSGLAVFYPHPQEVGSGLAVAGACALVLALTIAAVAAARAWPHLVVGWLWFLGTLVPVLGFVQVGTQARADRYLYVPLVGLAVAVAWSGIALARRVPALRLPLRVTAVGVVAALAVTAHTQVTHWRDSLALFTRALDVTRDNYLAEHGVARALYTAGRAEEALPHYGAAIRIRPGWARPRIELAGVLAERDNLDGAAAHYTQGLMLTPGDVRARVALGRVLLRSGRISEAHAQLAQARAEVVAGAPLAKPLVASLFEGLGLIALDQGRDADAIVHLRAALAANPRRRLATLELAWLLATHRDASLRAPAQAVQLSEALVAQVDGGDPRALDTLAAAYASAGRWDEATLAAERAAAEAEARGDAQLAAAVSARLALYRQRQPYLSP